VAGARARATATPPPHYRNSRSGRPQKTAVLHLEQGGVHDHGRPSHKHVILAPRQTGQGLGDLRHAHLASGTVHQAITVSADNGPNVLQVLGKLIDDLKRPETIGGETDNIPHMVKIYAVEAFQFPHGIRPLLRRTMVVTLPLPSMRA